MYSRSWADLWSKLEFSDVTLESDDGGQIRKHKVILRASSPKLAQENKRVTMRMKIIQEDISLQVCLHQKFGFCKYKEKCNKRHLDEECKDLVNCGSKKTCDKRHPKLCRRYVLEGSCSYGERCDYLHKEKYISPADHRLKGRIDELEKVLGEKVSEEKKMAVAIMELEKVVKAMSRKIIHLEEEIISVKASNHKACLNEPFKDTLEFKNSTPVSEKKVLAVGDTKSKKSKKDQYKCEKCDYKCKREETLLKHMNLKHEHQECKICSKSFSSTVELLQHIAKEHNISEEYVEKVTEIQDLDEVKIMEIDKIQESVDNNEKHRSFEFSESKFFDEFL